MKTKAHLLAALFLLSTLVPAQVADVKRILERYDELRPETSELGIYQLDWAESLEVALERAAKEDRPILLVIIHAQYGDIFSGHC
ncbi:MAG: hypothetical protein VCA73_08430 [Roseibacillus sp.]|jgi:hypothetical protein